MGTHNYSTYKYTCVCKPSHSSNFYRKPLSPPFPCSSETHAISSWGEQFFSQTSDTLCHEVVIASPLNPTATFRLSHLCYLKPPITFSLKLSDSTGLYKFHSWIQLSLFTPFMEGLTAHLFSVSLCWFLPCSRWLQLSGLNTFPQFFTCQCLLYMFYFTANSMVIS